MGKTRLGLAAIMSVFALLAWGCDNGESGSDAGDGGTVVDGSAKPSLFADGCPVAGKSLAKKIANPLLKMDGPDAIGMVGDYLLMNETSAFIIQGGDHNINTFWYYPGIIIDAVGIDACKQASQERFEELWLLTGTLNVASFTSSILRAFNGTKIEVVADGSDGKAAVVRVTGTDDVMWFLEDQLIAESMKKTPPVPKGRSKPYGLEIVVDYTLNPGSSVLQIAITLKNKNTTAVQNLIFGGAGQFGDSTTIRYYANTSMSVGSWSIDQSVPWIVAAGGDGAWAFSMKKSDMGTATISGVQALLDMDQVLQPIELKPAGETGDTAKLTYFFTVGGTDSNSATKNLQAVNPEPIPDMKYSLTPLTGKVTDAANGAGIKGVLVELLMENSKGDWKTLDSFYTQDDGTFSGQIANFGANGGNMKLVAGIDGRTPVATDEFKPPVTGDKNMVMAPAGALHVVLKDGNGKALPAKILLWQKNFVVKRLFSTKGDEVFPVEPGDYEVTVTRGFEYTMYTGAITVVSGNTAELSTTLLRSVDTPGWLSMDNHSHAGPSPDNSITIPKRIATVAGEGLEVVVSTDHEYIGSWQSGIDETGLWDWVATVTGQEVTANLPEHTNIYPVVPDYTIDVRGGFVKWFGLDISQIYTAERNRGAGLVQLNHPRNGCNYMCLIDYNRLTGTNDMTDPTALGFDATQTLWSWNFDIVEFQNGPAPIFVDPAEPKATGMFDDWQSFINLGHTKTAVGNSDSHDYDTPGTPRNYFVSSTDDPKNFKQDEMVKALKEGRIIVSNGAFARVKVNGTAGIGDTITDDGGEVDLYVRFDAPTDIDVAYFKVYVNCDQVLSMKTTSPDGVVKYEGTVKVPVTKDANVVVMGFGKKAMPRGFIQYDPAKVPRVITNPIYVDVNGNGKFDPPGGKTCAYDLDAP